MILHLLHDCGSTRHRAPIEFREVKLNSGHLRLEGVRCDGTAIEAYANPVNANELVAYNANADAHDPDRHERTMLDRRTGEEWISRSYGPWQPLVEFADQPAPLGPEQAALFEVDAT